MNRTTTACSLLLSLTVAAQATAQDDLPAPRSSASLALLDKACSKMLALGRGTFRTAESQDNVLARRLNAMVGDASLKVAGGWHGDLVWGRVGEAGDLLVRSRGRTAVRDGRRWLLRRDKLPSGEPIPFVLDPDLLFQVLQDLPAAARTVRDVAPATIAERPVAVLALSLTGDDASEFLQTGAIAPVQPGMNRVLMVGGLGARTHPPMPDAIVDLALFVDPTNGDVLRLRVKAYEKGGLPGNVVIQVAGAPGQATGDDEDEQDPADGPLVYRQGLPERKLGTWSMAYLLVDFADLGMATPPAELDEAGRRLLGTR